MKIGIILGSIREGRNGESVARWLEQAVAQRDDAQFELLDLKSFDVPLFTGAVPPGAANRQYDSAEVTAWGQAIDACDGFIFITPEYNHGVPGAFKNAVDSLGPEWTGKAAAIVAYGADGGVRAVEQWRQILANFNMYVVRAQLPLSLFTEFGPDGFAPDARREGELTAMLDQLIDATRRQAD